MDLIIKKFKGYKYLLTVLSASFLLLVQSCSTSDEESQDVERWTSTDPLSVKFRARNNKFLKGNLIENSSFELKKTKLNPISKQIEVQGWEFLGNDVKWVDISNGQFDKSFVHSGNRSVYINRQQADETETQGQGVLSEYIKVIPGNYRLTLYINLKNIKNPKSRLGTKIYDAVDIKIFYYDRNKLQINDEYFSPYHNKKINCGFKGVSFSNFEQIDSTGWLHINGYSEIFPFADGDIPDETKFVRIFIGLKGTGELWADDINFTYTNQNFTASERLSRFFDSTYGKAKLIIPQPKKVQILESKVYYNPHQPENLPCILVPPIADQKTMALAKLLEKRINNYLVKLGRVEKNNIHPLISHSVNDIPKKSTIIFSIGKTGLFERNIHQLPINKIIEHDQGYFIYSINSLSNVIFIYSDNTEGLNYAFQSTFQLFDNKGLLFHNANVIDYPSESDRSLLLTSLNNLSSEEKISEYFRFNHIYYPLVSSSFNNDSTVFSPKRSFYVTIDKILNKETINHINAEIIRGAGNINNIAFLFCPEFSKSISLKEALANYSENYTSNDVNAWLTYIHSLNTKKYGVEILPPFNHEPVISTSGCDNYFSKLISADLGNVKLMWQANGIITWQVDQSVIYQVKKDYRRSPAFVDFTLYPKGKSLQYFGNDSASPYKLMTSSLFEPYGNEISPEVYNETDGHIVVYEYTNILDKVRLKTASDFYWNRENYNPDFSLFKVLVSEFGADAAQEILKFNDLYFKARSELILAANKKNFYKNIRKAYQSIDDLKKTEKKLKTRYSNASMNELNIIFTDFIAELEHMKNKLGHTPLLQ